MYRIGLGLGSAFGAGFCFSNYLNNGLFDPKNLKPLQAASVLNPPLPPQDLVPISQKGEIKHSRDDMNISTSRVSEIMKHGYPSLDNLRIFDDYVLSYDRRF